VWVAARRRLTLVLGDEIIELLEFARSGEPYPRHSRASDLIFQHFAIVASDMAKSLGAFISNLRLVSYHPRRSPAPACVFRRRDGVQIP